MKYGQKMLFLRVSLCSHACIYPACTAQPLTDWPFSMGELVPDPTHGELWDCVPVPSHDRGQSKWERRPDCASESVKHPPNITWWFEPLKRSRDSWEAFRWGERVQVCAEQQSDSCFEEARLHNFIGWVNKLRKVDLCFLTLILVVS